MKAAKAVLSSGVCALVLALTPVLAFAAAPNDPLYAQQWALSGSTPSINIGPAWCASAGNVLVADVDTGADFNHADLAGKLIPGAAFLGGNGTQTGSGQAAVQDDNGHGTMTTGIMVADTNNGVGIAGVAPAGRALVVKVLKNDSSGNATGSATDVAAGIDYASSYPGVKVINLSIGTDTPGIINSLLGGPNPILPAIDRAIQRGVMVSAAAGNSSGAQSDYASKQGEALVVGALNRAGTIASYSSVGNIYAPGGDSGGTMTPAVSVVSTTLGNAYAAGDGTSFAAPQVAGITALLMAKGFSAAAARQQVLNTAVTQTNWPSADAAQALGLSDSGPTCVPGAAAAGAGAPPPVRPTSPRARPPAAPAQAPAAIPAPTSASPSPSASADPTPSPEDPPPAGSGTLAARTVDRPGGVYAILGLTFRADVSPLLLAAATVIGAAAGYGALFYFRMASRQ